MKVNELMGKLQDQNNKVIKPLLKELKVNAELYKRTKADLDGTVKELKALSAIIRLPAMTDQF